LRVTCCELEPRFCELGRLNFNLHRRTWEAMGDPLPVMVQGDSRRLCEVLGEADCLVGSPPYAEAGVSFDGEKNWKRMKEQGVAPSGGMNRRNKPNALSQGYGSTPGQLGAMKAGDVDAIVGSPPYAETIETRKGPSGMNVKTRANGKPMGYGKSEVQMNAEGYGSTPGQLGIERSDTFWAAARTIVEQCYAILRPSGVAIWVCKDFVRNKRRVPFSDDWLKLCQSVGFQLVCRHRAMLVKERTEQTLFGSETKRTERKSFFRRLAERKGSPRIDWEDVLCVRRV
jgi:hypothetical protein